MQGLNAFRPGSWWLYTVQPRPEAAATYTSSSSAGRAAEELLLGALLSVFGKKIFGSFLEETLRRLEKRAS